MLAQKEVSVRYDDNIKSRSDPDVLIQMDVTVSGGSDDLYTPENALARTYLYDPNEGKHTLEYMKPFHELNLAGKFGACWKIYGNFLHLHSYWAYVFPMCMGEKEARRRWLSPHDAQSWLVHHNSTKRNVFLWIMDEYQKIYAGAISANLRTPGQAESRRASSSPQKLFWTVRHWKTKISVSQLTMNGLECQVTFMRCGKSSWKR